MYKYSIETRIDDEELANKVAQYLYCAIMTGEKLIDVIYVLDMIYNMEIKIEEKKGEVK